MYIVKTEKTYKDNCSWACLHVLSHGAVPGQPWRHNDQPDTVINVILWLTMSVRRTGYHDLLP